MDLRAVTNRRWTALKTVCAVFDVGGVVLALAILEVKAVPRVAQQSAVWHPGETFSRKGY